MSVLWVGPSGGTLIGTWRYVAKPGTPDSDERTGVISHGKFTPLRVPFQLVRQDPAHLAW